MKEKEFRELVAVKELESQGYDFVCYDLPTGFFFSIYKDCERGVLRTEDFEVLPHFSIFEIERIIDRMQNNIDNLYLKINNNNKSR